jgi:tetratricopeptide (TPR) repeat protein
MRALREAQALLDAGRWSEAGAAFDAVAQKAVRVRDRRLAREAAQLGADAWRRDDRPGPALRLLQLALREDGDPVLGRVQLAAVLLDLGLLAEARQHVAQAVAAATTPEARALALDTAVGTALAAGDLPAAREGLEALVGLGVAEIAARFRHAQLDRLDGALARAEEGFLDVAHTLEPHAAAAGPAAAAWCEVGELRLLRRELLGEDHDAVAAFSRGVEGWTRAGRRAGLFRAEAWRLRALAADAPVVDTPIERALGYARERGLRLLEAELQVALGICRGDVRPIEAALTCCDEAPLARGRARVEALRLGGIVDRAAMWDEVGPDAPYICKADRKSVV